MVQRTFYNQNVVFSVCKGAMNALRYWQLRNDASSLSAHHPLMTIYRLIDTFTGTWQRGGFSGVLAEIGSAQIPYTKFRAVQILASYSRRYS
jgi:hypothetical protein